MSLYLDDLKAGQRFETASRTVTEAEIIAFAKEFDPQYYHVDPVAAQKSAFGGLISSGFHTLSLSMRLFFDLNLWPESVIASPGFVFLNEKPGRLDDHALATRLALFLTNSVPDSTLRTRADRSELNRPEVLRAETERLLASPHAERFVEGFLD